MQKQRLGNIIAFWLIFIGNCREVSNDEL